MRTALTLIFLGLAPAAWYALACWMRPFRPCRRCDGMGRTRRRNPFTRRPGRPRPCRHCRTTGLRLRYGRHVFNYLTATRAAARAAEQANRRPGGTASGARRREWSRHV